MNLTEQQALTIATAAIGNSRHAYQPGAEYAVALALVEAPPEIGAQIAALADELRKHQTTPPIDDPCDEWRVQ